MDMRDLAVHSASFFLGSSHRLQPRRLHWFWCKIRQKTRFHATTIHLSASLILHPICGIKSPQNPNFEGINRRFQAKCTKYWNFYIINTPLSISTKFCTTIKTTKYSSDMPQTNPKWQTAAIFEKQKLAISLQFDTVMHIEPMNNTSQ